jgi:hypothetical protein
MRIHDLTQEQCEMLDRLWACDSSDDIYNFFQSLDEEKYHMALTLHELLIQELEEKDNDLSNTTKARNMLAGIGVKC